ncbi:MAG: 50S ribosomal protein L32 [bacterium]
MGVPTKRRTKSQRKRRASHFALGLKQLTVCSHCKKPVLPHKVCTNCGYYRGRQVLKIKTALDKKSKKEEKKKARQEEEAKAKQEKAEVSKKNSLAS